MNETKSFEISKQIVGEAFRKVKQNKGKPGVDGVSIGKFEENLGDNLYKIWNRMSSGSYFPPPVKYVEIPKGKNEKRVLGVPTLGDRTAQMVAVTFLEPILEPVFSDNSYGYRPNRSAIDAVGKARKNCWKYDWAIDLDISGFFDNMDHDITMELLGGHTDIKWLLLYVLRWLKAPMQMPNGDILERERGTPQGGVISPILANLYLHHAFDAWMEDRAPSIPFERYADDIIIHCNSYEQAELVLGEIVKRLLEFKLELHPDKTKIVYCKDDNRKEDFGNKKFDFLGYEFRAREAVNKHSQHFVTFSPAISPKSKKHIYSAIRQLGLTSYTQISLDNLIKKIVPKIIGWYNYYGHFNKSSLKPISNHINRLIYKWLRKKFKRFRYNSKKAWNWFNKIIKSRLPKYYGTTS